MPRPQSAPTGRAAVLDLVKRKGPVAADALAEGLGITGMAVRQHLAALEAEGFVESEARAQGRGRPARLWRATAAADGYFPDAHAQLAAELIGQMKQAFGEAGLDQLLAARTRDQLNHYRGKIGEKASLKARLEALAALRAKEGYMAELVRDEDKSWLFVENHCPICAAARLCSGLCREELTLFREVLGPEVCVERVSHILAGAARCAYRIRPA